MSMKAFKRAIAAWAYGLIGGCVGGGAGAVSAYLGLTGARAAGLDVPAMNFKAMGVIFLSGVISHGVLFVMKSPLPPLEFDETTTFTKDQPKTP